MALGLSNGQVLLFKHSYAVTYPDNKRVITPQIDFPYGDKPLVLNQDGGALEHVAVNHNDETLLLAPPATSCTRRNWSAKKT